MKWGEGRGDYLRVELLLNFEQKEGQLFEGARGGGGGIIRGFKV